MELKGFEVLSKDTTLQYQYKYNNILKVISQYYDYNRKDLQPYYSYNTDLITEMIDNHFYY